jgi:hypothetical protein
LLFFFDALLLSSALASFSGCVRQHNSLWRANSAHNTNVFLPGELGALCQCTHFFVFVGIAPQDAHKPSAHAPAQRNWAPFHFPSFRPLPILGRERHGNHHHHSHHHSPAVAAAPSLSNRPPRSFLRCLGANAVVPLPDENQVVPELCFHGPVHLRAEGGREGGRAGDLARRARASCATRARSFSSSRISARSCRSNILDASTIFMSVKYFGCVNNIQRVAYIQCAKVETRMKAL